MANDPIKLVDVGALDRFKTDIDNEIPDSVQYSTMPTASADLVGKIVQYTGEDASGLGYDLINGHWYKCESWGTGYIWTDLYTDNIGNSSKPVVSSAVSSALQTKQNIIQVAEMPTASSTRVGDILQYIGTTTASYTNGFFYKCVPGSTSGTYQWLRVDVQPSSGGGGGGGEILITPRLGIAPNQWSDGTFVFDARSYHIPDSNRNVIDVDDLYNSYPTIWDRCGVCMDYYSIYNGEISSITFKCEHTPSSDLHFRVVSMPVTVIS